MHALVVCAAEVPGTIDVVARRAADADFVVGVDGGAAYVLEAGLTPDLVVGDFDSLPESVAEHLSRLNVSTQRFPADKDASDLDLALAAAQVRGADRVTVTGAFSGRLDHTLAAVGSLTRYAALQPVISEPGLDGWLLTSDARTCVEVDGGVLTLSLLALGGPAVVSVSGVRWPLEREILEPLSSRGISNEPAGPCQVTVHRGVLLVLAQTTCS